MTIFATGFDGVVSTLDTFIVIALDGIDDTALNGIDDMVVWLDTLVSLVMRLRAGDGEGEMSGGEGGDVWGRDWDCKAGIEAGLERKTWFLR